MWGEGAKEIKHYRHMPVGVLLSSVVINFVCAVRNRTERAAGNSNGNDTCRE